MKEFVEKLIERLSNAGESYIGWNNHKVAAYSHAIEIVNQLAEKYKVLEKTEELNKGWILCSERLPEVETEVLIVTKRKFRENVKFIITTAMYEDGTVRENDSCWCWYEIEGEWDEEEDCYIIPEGWWENKHYNPDECYNNTVDDEVIAWQPLPEPYKTEGQKVLTRIERIRSMSVEEMADAILEREEISMCLDFCQNLCGECENIPESECKKCLTKYLNSPEEQQKVIPTQHFEDRFNRVD